MLLTEEEIKKAFNESVQKYGIEHTHDFECVSWRGQIWRCDCALPSRVKDN